MMVLFSSYEDKIRITLCYALLDCVTEEISDRFKENDIHWIKLLHLCLLKWDETTPEHIRSFKFSCLCQNKFNQCENIL